MTIKLIDPEIIAHREPMRSPHPNELPGEENPRLSPPVEPVHILAAAFGDPETKTPILYYCQFGKPGDVCFAWVNRNQLEF